MYAGHYRGAIAPRPLGSERSEGDVRRWSGSLPFRLPAKQAAGFPHGAKRRGQIVNEAKRSERTLRGGRRNPSRSEAETRV
jgi:hypothetical protein